MKKTFLESEFVQYFIKVAFIGLIAISMKLAVEIRNNKNKANWLNVIISMITGIGGAVASGGIIESHFMPQYHSVLIGLVAILSEKIVSFFTERFNVDIFLIAITETIFQGISNFINPKK